MEKVLWQESFSVGAEGAVATLTTPWGLQVTGWDSRVSGRGRASPSPRLGQSPRQAVGFS